mgnify:CR=1 FL=1
MTRPPAQRRKRESDREQGNPTEQSEEVGQAAQQKKRGQIIMDLNYKVIRECTDSIKSGILKRIYLGEYIWSFSMLHVHWLFLYSKINSESNNSESENPLVQLWSHIKIRSLPRPRRLHLVCIHSSVRSSYQCFRPATALVLKASVEQNHPCHVSFGSAILVRTWDYHS